MVVKVPRLLGFRLCFSCLVMEVLVVFGGFDPFRKRVLLRLRSPYIACYIYQ